MPRFPAWLRSQLRHHDTANVDRATKHSTNYDPEHQHIPTAGELRGIPAIGRGVSGAIPGTRPEDIAR